jgi:hypothetical protein
MKKAHSEPVPKKHARLADAKRRQLFNIKIRDTERQSPPKKQLFNIKIRDTERQSPPLAPKLSPPKRSPPKRSPSKRSPPKRSPPKRSPSKRSPPKRSPPKTHVRQRKVFEITDTLTKEQIREQKMEKIKKLNAKFIEYIRNRNAGTLQPLKKEEVSAFDQLDKWIKKYDEEHKTKPTNKIAK